jgi:hypothetical protein
LQHLTEGGIVFDDQDVWHKNVLVLLMYVNIAQESCQELKIIKKIANDRPKGPDMKYVDKMFGNPPEK